FGNLWRRLEINHAPHSLVTSLEARVAELEAQVLRFRGAPPNITHSMASKIAQATISFDLPKTGSFLRSKVSSALFFRPSCPPLAVVRVRGREELISPIIEHLPDQRKRPYSGNLINLKSVPHSAITRMISNYADTHLPQYPCITESMLEDIVRRTQDDELGDTNSILIYGIPANSGLGHFEYFVLFIALAISAITLTWKAEDQARDASASFYESALKHLQALEGHSEIQALQISLLLAHYAHMCPERADNWTCIANAVRIVLSLGLYRESPEGLDPEQVRLRSVLFWVTYGMERSLCTNLRLPLSFPEELVNNKYQLSSHEEPFSQFAAGDIAKNSSAHHIYRYRGLETEVHRVLHLEEDIHRFGSESIADWIVDITGRLASWYKEAQGYTEYNMLEFKHVQFYHLRARIHRPTPRLRTRNFEDRGIVLESCMELIEDYLGQERRRRLFYPWHGVHILFETAVIALEAGWSSRDYQPLRDLAMQLIETSIPQCLQLLTRIGQRWNEATLCAQSLTPLLQKVSCALAAGESLSIYDDTSITEEIHGLLFSEPSLTWDHVPQTHYDFGLENDLFFENVSGDDTVLLQWAAEWEIVPAELL
ncbi:Pyrimidine pathway regulatory protein 1, partial [Lachnellula cervina]